jgi:hypothetical protein
MKKPDNRQTLEEIMNEVKKKQARKIRQISLHVCTVFGIDTREHWLGPFLCKDLCEDNLDATQKWIKSYLGDEDVLGLPLELEEYVSDFRSDLFRKVPDRLLGSVE